MQTEGFYDSILMRMLNRLGDAMILSILFVVGCLPVFTAGASLTAAYYAAMRGVAGEDGYVFKYYVKSFKQNFKQATKIWLIVLLALFVFGVDLWYWFRQWKDAAVAIAKPMLVVSVVLLALTFFIAMYVFPLQAKFDNKPKAQIKNAFLLSIRHFPITLLLTVFSALIALFIYLQPALASFVLLFAGCGACIYLYAYFMLICFKPYLKTAPEKDPDAWTVDVDETESDAEEEAEDEDDEKVEEAEENTQEEETEKN